jgi:DeoR/GlpR family transcriptional regulator of sugar metabolism
MMAVERQRQIAALVNERGSLRVAEISQIFDVTQETARRDLDLLEQEGKLKRSHGGAIRMQDDDGTDIPYLEREGTHVKEKMAIAEKAARMIEPGDRITLDASSTAWFLARALPDVPLTVLTNSVRVIQELAGKERIQVISTGGILRSTSLSLVGPLAEETLAKYHVNKAFVSCKGVHPVHGVSESNELQAMVKRTMVDIADERILLVDHSKLGVRDFTHAFPIERIHRLVTDDGADESLLFQFDSMKITVASR